VLLGGRKGLREGLQQAAGGSSTHSTTRGSQPNVSRCTFQATLQQDKQAQPLPLLLLLNQT
jgi:hypothetical protein